MLSTENSLDKNSPPPLEDDRSTKKTKFKAQGEHGDNPSMLSFRDKLMEQQRGMIDAEISREDFMGREQDIEIEREDVVIEQEGYLPSISFSQKVHEQLIKPWQSTVVVKLLGRMIGYKALCSRLETLWPNIEGYSVIDLDNGYFLVKLRKECDADFVLTEGPWLVAGHYLTVQPWSPHFDSSNEKIDKITAWIRLPGMPLHYYHKKIIRMLGHVIGKVIKIDYNTELATRGKFARIAVEVSLGSPLISQFLLDGRIQRIEYEALPTICFGCGKYGHISSSCPDNLSLETRGEKANDMALGGNTNANSEVSPAVVNLENPKFGPWMIVARRGNYRGNKGRIDAKEPNQNSFGKQRIGSRFSVLHQESGLENDAGVSSNAATTMDNHKKTVDPTKDKDMMISRDSKGPTQTKLAGSKGKLVTRNEKTDTPEHTAPTPLREIHTRPLPPTNEPSSSKQQSLEAMDRNISRNKPKLSRTHHFEPTLIPTSLDPKYHSAIILKSNFENETSQTPPSIPPKPNPNEEPSDIGDRDMEKVGKESSDSEYMEESEEDDSENSEESQFFVEADNMDVNQQGFEPLE
ncbi:hypothetical protein WN944_027430 [Citrus x changshan-huyou]|uniref:CCHC-type domain-containing protein n=1 Tax=Citrus x changshan-huyou TaxID=2935761 RepID=A0AAP0LIM5_9ROSI